MTIWTEGPTNSWKPDDGEEIRFAVLRIVERVPVKGWYVRHYELALFFFNSDKQEPGIDPVQYPDNLNKFCDSYLDHERNGILTLVTRGARRCRFIRYERIEDQDVRDAAAVTAWFMELPEEKTDARPRRPAS